MSTRILDRLLVTLDVAVEAFAICEVGPGARLVFDSVDAIVVHYVLAGTLHLTTNGDRPLVCGPGCVVIVPPRLGQALAGEADAVRDVAAADHCLMERDGMLLFDATDGGEDTLRVACGMIMASMSGSFGLIDRARQPIAGDLSDLPFVHNAFAVMHDEMRAPGLGTRAMAGALMKACLVALLRRVFARDGTGSVLLDALQDPRLGRAIAAVLDAPAGRHSVASLSASAGMSRSTFAREFSAAFGMSPMEFVGKTRLHHAAELLRATELPVKVIAGSIGFASRSHFSRAFRDAYGADPTKFRRAVTRPELDAPRPLRGSRDRFALDEEPDADA